MDWQWFTAVIGVPVAAGLIGWTVLLQKRLAVTEKDLSQFMVKAAETYITKDDLSQFQNAVNQRFDRIEDMLNDALKEGRCAPAKQP